MKINVSKCEVSCFHCWFWALLGQLLETWFCEGRQAEFDDRPSYELMLFCTTGLWTLGPLAPFATKFTLLWVLVCFCWQTILKKLYSESLHVLSLSDLRYLCALGEQQSSDAGTDAVDSEPQLVTELRGELAAAQRSWSDEKQCLQASVDSLKKLLAHIQPHGNVSSIDCTIVA